MNRILPFIAELRLQWQTNLWRSAYRIFVAILLLATASHTHAATYNLPADMGSGPFASCSFYTYYYACFSDISIDGTVNFTSDTNVTVFGTLTVAKNSTFNANGNWIRFTSYNGITIGDNVTGAVSFLSLAGFTAGNNVTITGMIYGYNNITLGNNVTVTGPLGSNGNITIGSNVNITGDVNTAQALSVISGVINGTCTYQTSNFVCGVGPGLSSFSVVPSTTSASTCAVAGGTPAAAWLTLTAKKSDGSTFTSYNGTVTISGIGNGTLSLKAGSGTLSGNTYTFASADNGVAVLYLTDPSAETVTPSVVDGTASGTSSASITFSNNVLVMSDADSLSPTYQPVAGRIHKISAAVWSKDATSGNCVINTKVNSSVPAKMWMTASALHPSGATAPAVSTANSCSGSLTLPTSAPGSNNISLPFANGSTTFYLCTSDVGQYSLNITAPTLPGSAANTTASNTFTTVPFAIVVYGIKQGTTNNTGASTATGPVFTMAGTAFQATVGAYLWNSAADVNNDGLPDNGVTFANATAGGTALRYAHTVSLKASLFKPAGGVAPTGATGELANTNGFPIAVANGTATVTTLTYPEVGSLTLTATPAANYLGAASLANRALIYSTTSQSQNSTVGRFTPHHFTTTVTHGCTSGAFTYAGQSPIAGQPFTVTVQALNAAGTVTQNYDSNLRDTFNMGYANPVSLSLLTPSTTLPSAGSIFTNGTAIINETLTVAPWTAAFSSAIRATDSLDGISSSGYAEGSTNFRIGRVRLMNASGSERLDLPMTMRVEYWRDATTGWVNNTADSCTGDTSISSANAVSLSKENTTMSATAFAALCAYDSGSPGASGIGCATAGTSTNTFLKGGRAGFAGNFRLTLKAPGIGNVGTMTVIASVPPWLQYPWSSSAASNPAAKAAFGQVKNSSAVIFRREVY